MEGWTASFTAMRVALGCVATRRKTLQPAPPQPTIATRARSSPTPSLHVSGTLAHREPQEIKDCHSRIDMYTGMGIEMQRRKEREECIRCATPWRDPVGHAWPTRSA